MALWDDVKKNLVEWYTVTSEKTSEAARIGTRRWDKFGISRDIERQFSELGNLVYSGLKEGREDLLDSEEFQGLVARIENLEEELKLKDEEIETIRAEYKREARRAAEKAAAEEAAAEEAAGGQEKPEPGEGGVGDGSEEPVSETILSGPVLHQGGEDSAILVEPEEDAGQADEALEVEPEPEASDAEPVPAEENGEGEDPEQESKKDV